MKTPYCTILKSLLNPDKQFIVNSKHPVVIEVLEKGEHLVINKMELSYYISINDTVLRFQTIFYTPEYRDIIELSILWYITVNFNSQEIHFSQLCAA